MDRYSSQLLAKGETYVSNLLLDNFIKIGMDADELLLYLLIKQNNNVIIPMPDAEKLGKKSGFSQQKIFELFHQLIEKKLVKISSFNEHGHQIDAYDFGLMYEKLFQLVKENSGTSVAEKDFKPNSSSQDFSKRQAVFDSIEKEFGRSLSSIEVEMISQWLDIDHYEPEIINLALKETVLNQVYNLKYMDRILVNWQKKNLKSPEQIEKYTQSRSGREEKGIDKYNGPDIPFIHLDE